MRNLVLCLDGTHNRKEDTTNVWRIYALLAEQVDKVQQLKFYDEGVGTRDDGFKGGAFGTGVFHSIRRAYCWLADNYQDDDRIFLFGFSRGAYTALSLANMIERCGVIRPGSGKTFAEAYRLYRLPGFIYNSASAQAFRGHSSGKVAQAKPYFLGLWDTVGSIYLPRFFDESMHVYSLPETVEFVMHAMALDEYRAAFWPTYFNSSLPSSTPYVQQRWFSGAHSNIGGGYASDPLPFASLEWMTRGVSSLTGLRFKQTVSYDSDAALLARPKDSHGEFFGGIGRVRHRRIAWGDTVDDSAIQRYLIFQTYRDSCVALNGCRKFLINIKEMAMTAGDDREKTELHSIALAPKKPKLSTEDLSLLEVYQRQDALSTQLWTHFLFVNIAVIAAVWLISKTATPLAWVAGALVLAIWLFFARGSLKTLLNMQGILLAIAHRIEGTLQESIFIRATRSEREIRGFHLVVDIFVGMICAAMLFARLLPDGNG